MRVIHIKPFSIKLIIYLCILAIMPLLLPISHPGSALTLEEERGFSVSIDYSLNIVLSSSTLSIPITPTKEGQFGRTYTDVYVDTNNAAGYTLTLQSNTDTLSNQKLNKTIDPLPSPTTCTDESDDSCDNFPSGKWGYRIGSTGAYLPATGIVNSPVRLAHTNTVTMNTDPVATLYFGTKIDADTPTGIYDGVELTFIATANIQKYNVTLLPATGVSSIQLDDNEPCTDTTSCIYALDEGSTHDLVATVADGYEFTGWTNATEYGTFSDATSATTTFIVGEGDAEISAGGEKKSILANCDNAATCMQTMTINNCPASESTVYDGRDGQGYQVMKLTDNNGKTMCWMLDNLKLGMVTFGSDKTSTNNKGTDRKLTPDDTNITASTVTKSGTGYFILPSSTDTGFTDDATGYTAAAINTGSVNSGTALHNTLAEWKYGVYYNYCAASAGTYCKSSSGDGSTSDDKSNRSIEGDICPKGWRMPTGGAGGEYAALYAKSDYNTYAKLVAALHLPLSGYFDNGSAGNQGAQDGITRRGLFWSSSRSNATNMYDLSVGGTTSSQSVNAANGSIRYRGVSIRCVLE